MRNFKFIICMFFIIGGFAHAQEGEAAKLESVTKDMLSVLYSDEYSDYTYEQRESAVQSILEQNYDVMVIIRRALGRNWKLLSAEEQVQAKELIEKLVVKAYINRLTGKECPVVKYGEPIIITDKRFEMPSIITFPDGKIFNVVYRFGRLPSGWQIYDIVAEDVSVVSNYRQQFDDHFRKGNGAELIEKLEKLLEEGKLDENIKL